MNPISAVRNLGFATRKLRLRIPSGALVLEVGSGDSPCPRSDVLLDLTLDSFERVGGKTVVDRPMVLGNVEQLPFRDRAFDYVIAFHVLEHMARPELFLSELQRVARAGYIETPAFWWERLVPMQMHRLEVGVESVGAGRRLVIQRKRCPVEQSELLFQFQHSFVSGMGWDRLSPYARVTQYHWTDRIDYRIVNPADEIDWPPEEQLPDAPSSDPRPLMRRVFKYMAQRRRRRLH